MSQIEEMTEGVQAVIFLARQALESIAECDHQQTKLWLATIRVVVEKTRKLLED